MKNIICILVVFVQSYSMIGQCDSKISDLLFKSSFSNNDSDTIINKYYKDQDSSYEFILEKNFDYLFYYSLKSGNEYGLLKIFNQSFSIDNFNHLSKVNALSIPSFNLSTYLEISEQIQYLHVHNCIKEFPKDLDLFNNLESLFIELCENYDIDSNNVLKSTNLIELNIVLNGSSSMPSEFFFKTLKNLIVSVNGDDPFDFRGIEKIPNVECIVVFGEKVQNLPIELLTLNNLHNLYIDLILNENNFSVLSKLNSLLYLEIYTDISALDFKIRKLPNLDTYFVIINDTMHVKDFIPLTEKHMPNVHIECDHVIDIDKYFNGIDKY